MSISAKVITNAKYSADDVKTILENIEGVSNLKMRSTSSCCYTILGFEFKKYEDSEDEQRQMNIFTNCNNYGLPCTMIDLGAWGSVEFILEKIWKILGGFYCKNDCEDVWENCAGSLAETNGLPYFIKEALLSGTMKNENDGNGLIQFIADWEERCNHKMDIVF